MGNDVIAELWRRMAAIYGHKWTSSYGLTDADGTWAMGLDGLTPKQIGHGINICIKEGASWPPSLPQFRDMCIGIPSQAQILEMLNNGKRTDDPFALEVFSHIDRWRVGHASYAERDALIRRAYSIARMQVLRDPGILRLENKP